jgi:hypothetical protein
MLQGSFEVLEFWRFSAFNLRWVLESGTQMIILHQLYRLSDSSVETDMERSGRIFVLASCMIIDFA